MRLFFAIFAKELLGFFRSYAQVFIVIYFFTAEVYIAGAGMDIEARNVAVGIVDKSAGGVSQKIISNLHAPEFAPPIYFASQRELSQKIFDKEIMVGLIFDESFEKDYYTHQGAQINTLIDTTSAAQSYMALAYLQNILFGMNEIHMPLELKIHKLFNENADTHTFMALSELLSVITLLSVVLSAIVFVKEKENGTWEIMLLMPVDPKTIILAKTLSQVVVIMLGVVLSVGFVLFRGFDIPLNGSLGAFFVLTFLYVFTTAGIGLFVAAVSKSVMQIAQYSVVIMMPMIFLSGAWTPIYAMHPLLQYLSLISPLRYYIEASESIFYRGTAFIDLLPYFGGVLGVGIVLYAIGFKKIGRLF
ncbi:MAG: ABC transporter permease [Epsilonproteobacteria bacterium]|nr:ABC transporter permease [Campylobacterota bacterium]